MRYAYLVYLFSIASALALAGLVLETPPPPSSLVITSCNGISTGSLYEDGNDPTTMGNPSSGSTFSFWNDKSPGGNNGAQSNSSLYPSYFSNQLGGKGIVRFKSPVSGFYFTTAGNPTHFFTSTQPVSMYTVVKLNDNTVNNRFFATFTDLSGSANAVFGVNATNGWYLTQFPANPFVSSVTPGTVSFHRYAFTFDGLGTSLSDYALYYDKVLQSPTNANQGHGDTLTAIGYDGDNGDTGNSFDMAFFCVWNKKLSAMELTAMDNWTSSFYGLP